MATVAHIADADWRRMAVAGLAREAAERGALDEARLVLDRVADHRLRNECLFVVAGIASSQHRFVEAQQLCTSLDDATRQQELWYGVAAEEALARQYELASRTAQQVRETGEWQRARLLEFIETCRRQGLRTQPKPIIADFAQEVFSLDGTDWTPRSEDVTNDERLMKETSDPTQRAVISTYLARWYQGHNQAARCRFAIATAAESISGIRSNRDRIRCCAELAETMIGAGLSQEARRLVDEVATRDVVASVLKRPDVKESDVYDLPPKVVFVLIRLGRIGDAFEVAESASGLLRGAETWWAAGIACALAGKTEEVRRRLPTMERERDRALLAAGVALGLQELAEKENKKAHQ